MINKKNLLGKTPEALGIKDAIHTAIVSVRAASPIKPGEKCGLNDKREAIPQVKGPGVADPFRKKIIVTGEAFWMILAQDEIPNVQHVWEHPDIDFSPPSNEVELNESLKSIADTLGVTYSQLMHACANMLENGEPIQYPGSLEEEDLDCAMDEISDYDLWYEYGNEVGYEFENVGSMCCPEYEYPTCNIFKYEDKEKNLV